jgi:hypothetical protein
MANQLVSDEYKDRLRTSARIGRDDKTCSIRFECPELETLAKNSNNNNNSSTNSTAEISNLNNHNIHSTVEKREN